MAKATNCELEGGTVYIKDALRLRDEAVKRRRPYPGFSCVECGELVQPHNKSTTGAGPHFEHRRRTKSPNCSRRTD